jgi:hypothetical protein
MAVKRMLVVAMVLGLVAMIGGQASAGKKKPKPYKSEEATIAIAHTMLFSSTGEVNSVTAKEFENSCAVPTTNGLDAYVWEVPAPYQTSEWTFKGLGQAQVQWSLYAFFYDKACERIGAISADQAATQGDAIGVMPAGTAYVLMADFAGDPVTVHYELTPYKAPKLF